MSDFTFKAQAECDVCGQYLSSEDEQCDHNGESVETRIFRRVGGGRESLVGVKAVRSRKWHDLKEEVGDDWIAYEYLGTKDIVNSMLTSSFWEGVHDLPKQSMSLQAPVNVGDDSK